MSESNNGTSERCAAIKTRHADARLTDWYSLLLEDKKEKNVKPEETHQHRPTQDTKLQQQENQGQEQPRLSVKTIMEQQQFEQAELPDTTETVRRKLEYIILRLQEQLNLTILFISHDLPVVRQMCDRIAVLKNGKLCEISNTEDLFIKPKHDYTKELLKLMPKIESIYN